MALSDSVDAVGTVLRRRPSDLLPLYVLGAAIPAIVRVVPFLAAVIGYVHLARAGRLEAARAELEDVETSMPDPNADPEAFEAWLDQFFPVVEQLLTPTIGLLLVGSALVSVLLGIALYAIASAGQLSACYGRLRDERGLVAGIDGARRYWGRFVGLYVLEFLLWGAVIVGGVIAAALLAGELSLSDPALGSLAGLFVGLLTVLALLVVRAAFAFAPVAVVADDAGVVGSLSSVGGFVRARPVGAIVYYVASIGALIALWILAVLLVRVDVVSIVSLLALLVVSPALDLLKTAFYVEYRGRLTPPPAPERSLRAQVRDGLRRGWDEMLSFVRATPGTHAFVVVLAVVSFAVGWRVAAPYAGTVEASIAARLEDHVPPAAALEFFGNNWAVALVTAVSGVALAIPAIVSLLFNGVFMGVLTHLEVELFELVAFLVPHGIFEVPAIFVATALGISLGRSWWQLLRGEIGQVAFADRFERAFWVLVGTGILLAVAAVVEGFVSPYYYDLLVNL